MTFNKAEYVFPSLIAKNYKLLMLRKKRNLKRKIANNSRNINRRK